jgi:uncharacterized membrane protein
VFAHDLHVMLALASLAAMLGVAAEGAARLARARPPGRAAAAGSGVVAILLGMAAAGGLALLLGGQRPKEFLHLVYGLLALGLVPLADSLAAQAGPRRRALVRFLGALVAAGVIMRLFATG